MFDSIFAYPKCECGVSLEVEIQFKFGECALRHYYIGDYIPACHIGFHLISGRKEHCLRCKRELHFYAVVRELQLIDVVSDKELLRMDLLSLPVVEENQYRQQLYQRACEEAVGSPKESSAFSLHPLPVGGPLFAFGQTWIVTQRFLKKPNLQANASSLWSFFHRNTGEQYLYQVFHESFGERWIEVSNTETNNLLVFDRYSFENESMYTDL